MLTMQSAPATEPQKNFVATLLRDREWDQAKVLEIAPSREYSKSQASELITYLKAQPKKAKASGGVDSLVTEAGMYKQGDRIFKVQLAIHGSGKLYAKELVKQDSDGDAWVFVYRPGAIGRLRAEDKMTLEQAKEFGALYGTCCQCGRTLTREESIEAGIGPVCAAKGGWA